MAHKTEKNQCQLRSSLEGKGFAKVLAPDLAFTMDGSVCTLKLSSRGCMMGLKKITSPLTHLHACKYSDFIFLILYLFYQFSIELIISLFQFDGPSGEHLKHAAATYCENQSIALESLKMRQKKDQKLAQSLSVSNLITMLFYFVKVCNLILKFCSLCSIDII